MTPIILGSSRSWSRCITASTHICPKNSFSPPTSLDDSVVMAHFFNSSRFSAASLPSMDTVGEKKHDVILIARTEIQYTIGKKK